MLNNHQKLCLHVFPNSHQTVTVWGKAVFMDKTTFFEPDVFNSGGLGTGIGLMKMDGLMQRIDQQNLASVKFSVTLFQQQPAYQIVEMTIKDNLYQLHVTTAKELQAAASPAFTFDGQTWKFLIHRHHDGRLMIRLDCIAIDKPTKTTINIKATLSTGEKAERKWSFGLYCTEDVIFDAKIEDMDQIHATMTLDLVN